MMTPVRFGTLYTFPPSKLTRYPNGETNMPALTQAAMQNDMASGRYTGDDVLPWAEASLIATGQTATNIRRVATDKLNQRGKDPLKQTDPSRYND